MKTASPIISAATVCCATGHGLDAFFEALAQERTGLKFNDLDWLDTESHIGRVAGLEEVRITAGLDAYDCRNNRLAQLALDMDGFHDTVRRAVSRYGADRIGIVLGTSTSGIRATEEAYADRARKDGPLPEWFRIETTHAYHSLAFFLRDLIGVEGPCYVVSTACSSSSKALVDAGQLIEQGICDAVIAGGVDTLCQLTLSGFESLELIDHGLTRPFDVSRAGINIGEAAGFALIENAAAETVVGDPLVSILGAGESSDAFHMSSPDPDGAGALKSMADALAAAGLTPKDIDHIVLHGTGTKLNDKIEDIAISKLFGTSTSCGSTKGWTGHTLGAAGILAALTALFCLRSNTLPRNLNLETVDPEFSSNFRLDSVHADVAHVMTNAFGFGGSNCSIIFGRAS